MSTAIGVAGGLQTPKPLTLAGAVRTEVFNAQQSGGFTALAVNYCNTTAGAITVLLEFFDGAAYWPLDKRSVAANARDLWQDFPLRLRQNQSLHATGAAGLTVTVDAVLDSGKSQSGGAS